MKKINIISFFVTLITVYSSFSQNTITIKNLDINTKNSDFGIVKYQDNKVVYASSQKQKRLFKRKWKPNMQAYLDLYQGNLIDSSKSIKNVVSFSKKINTKYHESSVAFSSDFSTVYFTRNNYINGKLGKKSNSDNKVVLKLYKATNNNGEWSNIKELPFNSDNYSVGHPAISTNGKKLYFSSDMPGSYGETDIFVVDILADNKYSLPKNLGKKINTSGKEMFPFVDENNILYFSSDRKKDGFGGLDIYSSIIDNNNYSTPVNLGNPINSISDDFAFIKSKDLDEGYFSSNRYGGKGDDDIYAYKGKLQKTVRKTCKNKLEGIVIDKKSGTILSNVLVSVYNKKNVLLNTYITSKKGTFELNSNCYTTIKIIANKEGFNSVEQNVLIEEGTIKKVKLALKRSNKFTDENEVVKTDDGIYKINIGNIYFDLNKHNIRYSERSKLDRLVAIMKKYPSIRVQIASHTDNRGKDDFNLKLSERRAKSTRDYVISRGITSDRIFGNGYGESQPVNRCRNGVKCNEQEYQLNRRTEFTIVSY